MKCVCVSLIFLFAAAVAAAQDYQVGQYYEPYGTCTGSETVSVETVYDAPYRSYTEKPIVYPEYYPQPVYVPRVETYARPVYYPSYYRPYYGYRSRPYYHGRWRSRRDYRRRSHDMRRYRRRCDD